MQLDTGTRSYGFVYAVAFHPDGKHVLSGTMDELQRWRLADGREVRKEREMRVFSISVSRDDKWIVCGTAKGASVWDGEMRKEVIHVEGEIGVDAIDVCPDSTRFATGNDENTVSVWSMVTGERLVGPLKHDAYVDVNGIRFSPDGDRIATACYRGIRIFDSRNGDEFVTIKTGLPTWGAITPLAWSSNGQNIFALSHDDEIMIFDTVTSAGTQLSKLQILRDGSERVPSIALAPNGKFIAILAGQSMSFLDTLTLTPIGPVIEDNEGIWSVAISPDSSCIASGRYDGKIVIRNLGKILPESYGPFSVSIHAFILLTC